MKSIWHTYEKALRNYCKNFDVQLHFHVNSSLTFFPTPQNNVSPLVEI